MNVLLIVPHSDFVPTLPLGPLSIATYLNSHGHNATICDCTEDKNTYKTFLENGKLPDIAAISLMSSSGLKNATEISKEFQKAGTVTVWGGGFTSAYYDIILDSGCTDHISLGDGETSITQLADALEKQTDISEVSGLVYKKDGVTVRNKIVSLSQEELPELDLRLVDPKKYVQPFFCTKRMVHLYLSRGCPFNCSFCNRELMGDYRYRVKNTEYVINEIKYLVNECGCDGIYFYDELWCKDKQSAYDFCDRLDREKLQFSFGIYARIGQYDKEALQRLYSSGCRWILFGIESGSKRLRESVNKYLDEDKIYETFENCRDIGIITQAAFIVGLPGETEEDLKMTVNMAMSLKADLLPFSVYTPIRGSKLFKELLSEGKIEDVKNTEELCDIPFPYEKVEKNFTCVPSKELEVVRAFFRWAGFSASSTSDNLSKTEIAKEIIERYAKTVFSGGKINISAVKDSITVLYEVVSNVFFHPMIRKKYGLFRKNFK